MKQTYLFVILTIGLSSWLKAQDYATFSTTRAVVLNCPDSTIKANVLIVDEKLKLNDELKYYWYNNETIGCNRGGINGKALQGIYMVISKNGALLTEGQFDKGLIVGKWKYWYASGELKKVEIWKDGLLNGMLTSYNEKGELISEVEYKRGELVQKDDKPFFKSIFKKKEKEEKTGSDSTNTKMNDLMND